MIDFTRVGGVEVTKRGLLASLHGEQLRIEPVRDALERFVLVCDGTRRTVESAGTALRVSL